MTDAGEQAQERLSQADYARRTGVSKQRVNQLVKDGRIPLDADGLVIVEQADANLAAMLDQRKANRDRQIAMAAAHGLPAVAVAPGELPLEAPEQATDSAPRRPAQTPTNGATDYWEHKARREKIEADRADLAYRRAIGELVDAGEVARERFETAQLVATSLLQIPAKVAPVIAPQDPLRAERLLTEEINRVLNELAGDLDQPAAGEDAERAAARSA